MVEDGLIGHDGSPVGVLSLELLGWLVEEQPELAQPQTPQGHLALGLESACLKECPSAGAARCCPSLAACPAG